MILRERIVRLFVVFSASVVLNRSGLAFWLAFSFRIEWVSAGYQVSLVPLMTVQSGSLHLFFESTQPLSWRLRDVFLGRRGFLCILALVTLTWCRTRHYQSVNGDDAEEERKQRGRETNV